MSANRSVDRSAVAHENDRSSLCSFSFADSFVQLTDPDPQASQERSSLTLQFSTSHESPVTSH